MREAKEAGRPPAARVVAVAIDLVFTALVLWLAMITSSSVIRYIDTSIREHIFGQMPVLIPGNPPKIDFKLFRAQLAAHPLIVGRPLLNEVLFLIGTAAILIVIQRFARSIGSGRTPGEYLVDLRIERLRARTVPVFERAADEGAEQLRERVLDRISDSLRIAYLKEIADNIIELISPLKKLPGDYRLMGLAAIAITIALSFATAIVLSPHSTLAKLPFIAPSGNTAYIARISLYLGLASLAVGYSIAMAGASLVHPALLLLIAVFYEFTVASVGLSGGRSWWLTVPHWTIVILAVFAPNARTFRRAAFAVVWALAVVAVFDTLRLTPLALIKTGIWPVLKSWPAVIVYASAVTIALARVPRRISARTIFATMALVTIAYFAVALRVGEQQLASSFYYSISAILDFLIIFWFLLGRNLVTPCIAASGVTISHTESFVSPTQMPRILIAVCLAELALIAILQMLFPDIDQTSSKYVVAIPAHRGVALFILAIAVVLASLNALTARRAIWLFAIWIFSLAMIIAYFGASSLILNAEQVTLVSEQIQAQLSNVVRLSAIVLLTVGILLEIVSGHRQITAEASSDTSNGAMLTYLGVLALFSVLTHLMLASKTYSPFAAAAYTFQGMSLMWPAIAVMAALMALGGVSDAGSRAIGRALLVGAALSVICDLLRRSWGNPASLGLTHQLIAMTIGDLGIVAAVTAIVMSDRAIGAFDAVSAGVACAFGFVIAYVGELVVPLLTMIIGVPAHMLGIVPLINLTEKWLMYTPYGPNGSPIPHADLVIFYVLAPALGALAALAAWSTRRGEGSPRIVAAAIAALVAGIAYAIPLYQNPFLAAGFGQDIVSTASSIGMAHDAYTKATVYLALPMLLIAWFIHAHLPSSAAPPEIEPVTSAAQTA